MKHTRFAKVLVAMFAGVLMVAALGGCAQQDTAAAQQQSENRQYMTQVNQTMDDLKRYRAATWWACARRPTTRSRLSTT